MTRQKSNHESVPEWEPLENHLKNLDSPELPASWKKDILSHACQLENSSEPQAIGIQVPKHAEDHWFIITVGWIQHMFSKLTPVQISMLLIWSFALIGGKVDHWLNASDASNVPRYYHLSLTESFNAQIEEWELAGLDFPQTFEKEENKPSETNTNRTSTPGPRSSLKEDNTTYPSLVAMGRPCHTTPVAFICSKKVTLETLYSFKRPLPPLPVRHGSGTIRSTSATTTSAI
jgi:hypothetical protein